MAACAGTRSPPRARAARVGDPCVLERLDLELAGRLAQSFSTRTTTSMQLNMDRMVPTAVRIVQSFAFSI